MLSEVNEVGRGAKEFQGNQYKSGEPAEVASTPQDDVLSKTAKETGVSERTVATAF